MALFPPKNPAPAPAPIPMPAAARPTTLSAEDIARARNIGSQIRGRFAQTLVGQDNLRESLITTLVAGGHILIESVPGLAKTTAAQTLATSVSGSFKRVQCTPDLVGTQVFDFATQKFSTQIGPIHANFVLLDEINRSNAKTQSAMLEAMAEGATTIGGQRIALPKPFMVIATQNPIEEEGTFNLPEAQMDRFMMKAVLTYPTAQEEQRMLAMLTRRGSDTVDQHALTGDTVSISDVEFLRSAARRVHVSDAIMQYAVNIAATSRGAGTKPVQGLSSLVRLGASPRASIALVRIGQANALLQGRDYVIPEDVKAFAHEVLRHRILMTFEALADGVTSDQVVDAVLHYINEHYSESLTLDQLAEQFFISKYHLLRKFDAQVGTTVHRYILQKRLLNAKQLLAGGVPPNEVCQYCGFGDYANFYRAFKAEYNQTPRQYIQEAKGK